MLALAAMALLMFACAQNKPLPDAAKSAQSIAPSVAQDRRRRRTRIVTRYRATASNPSHGARSLDSTATSTGLQQVDEVAPLRARITETGPVLPEDIGPAPAQTLDMTAGDQGPIGLSESAVRRALDPLLGRMANCAAATTDENGRGPHGHVSIRIRVRHDGQPIAARVSGGGGPAEFITCVRRVVASARFAAFRGPDAIVNWGFDID